MFTHMHNEPNHNPYTALSEKIEQIKRLKNHKSSDKGSFQEKIMKHAEIYFMIENIYTLIRGV